MLWDCHEAVRHNYSHVFKSVNHHDTFRLLTSRDLQSFICQECRTFKEKKHRKEKKKVHCFFIFSSCNWTCMQLTLQWPGSFCIVCLYILYITTVLEKLYTTLTLILKTNCEVCLSYFSILPQGLNNKTICKIPETVRNWTIHGLWLEIQWMFPHLLIWNKIKRNSLYFFSVSLTLFLLKSWDLFWKNKNKKKPTSEILYI